MDNLVKIYKSMEIASGLNLFVTQNPTTTSLPEIQTEGDEDVGAQESGLETPKTVKNQKNKRPFSKNLSKPNSKSSGRNRVKPFFLSNKRVQVPQSPDNETPLRQAKDDLRKMKMTIEVFDNKSSSSNVHPPSKEKQSPNLSPFFWLREDINQEKPSQEIELDHLTGTPVKPPSFSDIKDLDDDMCSNMPLKENTLEKGNNMDLFDSEMFDWTQRERSPELCLSPTNEAMVGAEGEFDRRLEKLEEHLKCGAVSNELHDCLSSGSETDDNQNGSVLSCKRGWKVSNRSHTKRRKENLGQACDFELDLGSSKDYYSLKDTCVGSPDLGLPDEVTDLLVSKLASQKSKRGISEEKELNKSKKMYKNVRQNNTISAEKGRGKEEILVTPAEIDEVVVSKDTRQKKSISFPDNREKKRYSQEMRCEIKDKVSEDGFCRKKVKGKSDVHPEVVAQAEGNNNGFPCGNDLEGSLTIGKVLSQSKLPTLRKCDAISSRCAFCQATEETEASGEMVHYSSGRPVTENYSAGSVLHVHRNCTEWAPNVYFEGDIVVNLEEELSRSRRIKCSLCGIKGAALGCYEKTCRKSFHVTCAKRLKTCRWDNDHFVILCPLHASLKLPTELSMRKPRKQTSNKIRKNSTRQSQLAVGENTNRLWSLSRPSEKIALCCSGLSTTEKETVSEFAKASGAVMLTTWSSTVTHVIASVDENESCRRTLKVLMGILDGRWILSFKWVQACMKAMKLVDEDSYEISCDIHGVKNGPRFGRLRLLNKQPKLFTGYKFYLSGDFAPSYKGYLQDLVIAAGGTILHRKPISESDDMASSSPSTIIVYGVELPEKSDLREKDTILASRKSDAEALATSTGSAVANNLWVLNCIAGHKLLDL